jgi:hypothetical protein
MRNALLLSLALGVLGGCAVDGLYEGRIEINSFARLESGLVVWLAEPAEELVQLAPAVGSIEVRSLFVPEEGERVVRLVTGPDPDAADELFAFTAPIDEREIDITDSVIRIAPATAAAPVRFPLGARFGGMAFHPGGRFAILYHPPSDADEAGGLFNQNEVAVLDLSREPAEADNPRLLTIGMGGRSVEGVAFPGTMSIQGVPRDLVVFEADGAIVLLDLADPTLDPVTVKLKNEGDNRIIVPEQIVTRPGDLAFDPMLILRAPGAQEIFSVALVQRPDGLPGFATALNQFDSGVYQPVDMALVEDDGHPLLVVAGAGTTSVTVIDVETAYAFYIELDGYVSALIGHTRIDGASEVVMYGASQWIYFLAVDDLAEEKGSNLEDVYVEDGMASAWRFGEDELLAVPYSGNGLTLIDLTAREVTRLTSDESYSWSEADVYGDVLFYAMAQDDRVISLDLGTGHPEPLVLDEPVAAFEIFPDTGTGVVLHDTPSGRATLFPLADPRREAALIIDGLWLRDLLDEEVQP